MFSESARQKIQEHVAKMPTELQCEPATDEQLREFEEQFGLIPNNHRWFLQTIGAGYFGSDFVDDIISLSKTHAKFRREFGPPSGWTMENVFVIGWDGFGNPFGIETTTGRIVVEDHNFGGIYELASSLEEFLLKKIRK
jgi:hypothetical protein